MNTRQELVAEIEYLREKVNQLKREKFDLALLLQSTTEHADALEEDLQNPGFVTAKLLEQNVTSMQKIEAAHLPESKTALLQEKINYLQQQLLESKQLNFDLELLLQTTTAHADSLEDELKLTTEKILQEKQDLEIILETTTQHSDFVENELQHKAEEALKESNQRLAQFLEAMPMGVYVVDNKGKSFYINQKTQEILGIYELLKFADATTRLRYALHIAEQVLNCSFNDNKRTLPTLSSSQDNDSHIVLPSHACQVFIAGTQENYPLDQQPIARALKGESVSVEDIELRLSDKTIPLEIHASPIFDGNNQVLYAIAVLQDITQRKQAESARIQLIQEQEAHKAAKCLNSHLQQEIYEKQCAEASLQKANQELQRLAILDALTQIPNRRRLDEYLDSEWKRAARDCVPLSLIMCDVDYFKRYNDTYGHCIGDKCLQRIAKAISHAIKRPADLVARYGGEEFLVVLPSTNAEGAMKVAFSIRSEIRMLRIIHATSPVDRYITLSMGIASVVPTPDISSDSLLTLTDDSLYEAKLQGRNHIVVNHTV